ncbi:MAG: hypothetical protein HY825_12130 [Acidobacteria bacterium]|nr:hypothetical protein [Acidobacteriota bacterium]
MKSRIGLVLLVGCLVAVPGVVQAQYFFDNFDAYVAGSGIMGQGGWTTWGGAPAANTTVVNTHSFSSPNSLAVSGPADIVHAFAGLTTGTWYARVRTYVPSTATGELFFIILNRFDGGACSGTACNWSVQLVLCRTGCTTTGANPGFVTNIGGSDVAGTGSTALLTDQWVDVLVQINLTTNQYSIYYNNVLLDTLAWTTTGDINIAAFDLFSNASTESYMDNVWLDTTVPVELQTFTVE